MPFKKFLLKSLATVTLFTGAYTVMQSVNTQTIHAAKVDVTLSLEQTSYANDIIKVKTILPATYDRNINIRAKDTHVYIVDSLGRNMTFDKFAYFKDGVSESLFYLYDGQFYDGTYTVISKGVMTNGDTYIVKQSFLVKDKKFAGTTTIPNALKNITQPQIVFEENKISFTNIWPVKGSTHVGLNYVLNWYPEKDGFPIKKTVYNNNGKVVSQNDEESYVKAGYASLRSHTDIDTYADGIYTIVLQGQTPASSGRQLFYKAYSFEVKDKKFLKEVAVPSQYSKAPSAMFRLYNPKTKLHFYTIHSSEMKLLQTRGYIFEGIAWYNSSNPTGIPVYRVFNKQTGERIFTRNKDELAKFMARGWLNEGIAFRMQNSGHAIYRLVNKQTKRYVLSASRDEVDKLVKTGNWINEGIAFYAAFR